jgi:hypothetical protein
LVVGDRVARGEVNWNDGDLVLVLSCSLSETCSGDSLQVLALEATLGGHSERPLVECNPRSNSGLVCAWRHWDDQDGHGDPWARQVGVFEGVGVAWGTAASDCRARAVRDAIVVAGADVGVPGGVSYSPD